MCGSMEDIQFPTAEIRREKKTYKLKLTRTLTVTVLTLTDHKWKKTMIKTKLATHKQIKKILIKYNKVQSEM